MKLLKTSITTVLFSLLMFGLIIDADAQDKRSAVKTYNKALELGQSGEYEQAINIFNQAINQAQELGEEGKDIVQRSQDKLPQIHYQLALQKYKTFQSDKTLENLNTAIEEFRNTKDVSEEYGDTKTAERANGIITKLMYQKSLVQYQQKNLKEALNALDQVIERDSNYVNAYYQKGIVIKNMDAKNLEDAISQFDKAIEVAEKTGANQAATRAQNAAREELVYRGAQAIQSKNFDRAIELLNRALEYDSTSANAYYRLAEAYNKLQEWQQAAEHAQQGLEYVSGGKTEQAKIYFELATAYQGLGQTEEACTAFGNAAYGSFKSSAEHQMEYELECESATN